ncbi:DUF6298 domain-containing protein [Opitutus terrae]|uniref:DUF6298 domain-containing protein n=1 Tax=Opitutus terrae (strain DSM 11246 / JCM 15787 / PB90-1) TaxID=452637 RepID=B1ZXK6_OPITP|nr:DUF6298 domain-containing protein [Opitutus terrae]ACB77001.1 conserved hypothetical protein [Opitutus terrae PB90-1]
MIRLRLLVCGVWLAMGAASLRAAVEEPTLPPIDFSHAGYRGGDGAIPEVPSVVRVKPSGGDDTALLQAAIDHVGALPARGDGGRGAVLLEPGRFRVSGSLQLRADGVVLRGSTDPQSPSVVLATGVGRRTLIQVGHQGAPATARAVPVMADAAVGARRLRVDDVTGFATGDRVVVERPSTAEWIAALGMNTDKGNFVADRTHWKPGSRNLVWDRTIVAIDVPAKELELNAPITAALEQRFGGGSVAKVTDARIVRHVGIEQLVLESEFAADRPLDEEHSWIAVAIDSAEDAWVRKVTARHFVSSAVRVGPRARRVTVEDCRSEQPVSEIGGYRRLSFYVEGQQVLVQRCAAEQSVNGFGLGFCAAGPNVFLDCVAREAKGASGAYESWNAGTLFERVTIEGAALRLTREMQRTQGGGWTAGNSVVWNCRAEAIEVQGPDGAPVVERTAEESLYASQLAKRRGNAATRAAPNQRVEGNALHLAEVSELQFEPTPEAPKPVHPLEIVGGRFVVDGRVVWGGQFNSAWWKGQQSPAIAAETSGRSVTRFMPGRIGRGLTEDLEQLAADMIERDMPFYTGGPGLWYDRRRDDHLKIPRADGNVWAPFYELPWARSGQGVAWDGLSKYDLARFNPWYFGRMREFARVCGEHGLVLHYNLYNTHNILETFAHYVEYPWRTANCINDIGLPEPVKLDPKETVHRSDVIYNVDHPGRRALHRAYIFHTLDQLGDQPNVVLSLAFQFAGPLAFQEFFLDTVAEWEREHGRSVTIELITSKDITDAILADPVRARQIDVIDMRYWQRQPDGTLWAPRGDVNLAFREQNTVLFGKGVDTPPDTTPLAVYRAVREYRDRFPQKPIVAWHGGCGPIPVLMAGGAQALMRNPSAGQSQGGARDDAAFNRWVRDELSAVLMRMAPRDGWVAEPDTAWCLADDRGENVLIYSLAGESIRLDRAIDKSDGGATRGVWFDPKNGETKPAKIGSTVAGAVIVKPSTGAWALRVWGI